MPAITRTARLCALVIITLGVVLTSLVSTPAQAREPEAVALGAGQVKQQQEREAVRKARAAKALNARLRTAQSIARNQVGDPYSYGASGPNAFDCSGLVYYSYRRAGFPVPRTSGAQAGFTRRIAKSNMRPGDLMFFYGSGGVYHAAIFLRWERGHAVMVHSPGSGSRVQVAAPWTDSWFGGTLRR